MGAESAAGAVFGALADPTRRAIVAELGRRESATATELARLYPISRQAVAKHLAALSQAGLVAAARSGRETRYRLEPGALVAPRDWLASVGREWDGRLERLRDVVKQ